MNVKYFLLFVVSLFIIIGLLPYVEGVRKFWNGRRFAGTVGEPSMPGPHRRVYRITEQWATQRVDNFNITNKNTWQNRYFVNKLYFQSGGPVFLLLRGEDRANAAFMIEGAWIMYAKIFGAMCFQLEHRFYGKSFPTENLSVENLKLLTSEQALADTSNFIQSMTKQYNISADTPWIIFGGSYAGALSVWLAEVYPDLVFGVVSSSGPIDPTVNFLNYLQAVSSSLSSYSIMCSDAIEQAFETIRSLLSGNEAGQASLYNTLQLCDTAINATSLDISNLLYTLTGDFMYIVQYNNDNTDNNNVNIEVACNIMTNYSIGTALERFAQLNNLLLAELGDNCVDFKYHEVIKQLKNVSQNSEVAYGGDRQWTYQTCNEFGYFQSSQSDLQIFGNEFPLSFFTDQCTDVFGPGFELDAIQQRVKRTNVYYGALNPHVSNVLCVQGSGDPWHLVGYFKNTTNGMDSLFIPGTAHCADMYQPSPNDPIQLTQARQIIIQYINNLLYGNSSSEETSTPAQTTKKHPAASTNEQSQIQIEGGSNSGQHFDAGDEFIQEVNTNKGSPPVAVTIEQQQIANSNAGSNSNESPNGSGSQNEQILTTINIFESPVGNQAAPPMNSPPVPTVPSMTNTAAALRNVQTNQPSAANNWVTSPTTKANVPAIPLVNPVGIQAALPMNSPPVPAVPSPPNTAAALQNLQANQPSAATNWVTLNPAATPSPTPTAKANVPVIPLANPLAGLNTFEAILTHHSSESSGGGPWARHRSSSGW